MKKLRTTADQNARMHLIGRLWLATGMILICTIPLWLALDYGVSPDWTVFGKWAVISPMIIMALSGVAEPIYEELSKYFNVDYDAAGSIGKRYRREDEIGTPFAICVDFDTETDGCVTIRDRDTMEQIRIPVEQVREYIEQRLIF